MARKGWWAAAFVVLVAFPPAHAMEAQGSFAVAGSLQVPHGASFEGAPLALLRWSPEGGDPLGLDDFHVRASVVRVRYYHSQFVSADSPLALDGVEAEAAHRDEQYELHNVTVTLLQERPGAYFAVDAKGVAPLSFFATREAASVEARNESRLSSTGQPQSGAGPDVHSYYRVVDKEHLLLTGAGRVHQEGAVALKLFGLDVRVEADENTTTLHTGASSMGPSHAPGVGASRRDWLVLEAQDVVLDASSRGAWEVAASAGALRWEGKAVFRCLQGEMRTAGGRYLASPRPVTLVGAFEGTIWPEGERHAVHARMVVAGDLATTSMEVASGGAVSPRADAPLLPWLGVAVGLAASGLGGVFAWRRRRPTALAPPSPSGPTAEECVGHANEHIQVGELEAALPWILQARRRAPTSALACGTHAFVLGELGRVDEALVAYQEASRLAPGESEYALDAARLAHVAGMPPGQVEDLLEQALARSPAQVEELERDGFFDALATRPRYEHMVERAWRRHVGDLSGPED